MNKYRKQICLDALSLSPGQSTRDITCPWCKARNDVEANSFSVTRIDAGIHFKCFRAKCDKHGFIGTMFSELEKQADKPKPVRTFNRPLSHIPTNIRHWLYEKYHLTTEMIDNNHLRYDFAVNYLHMPVYNRIGYEIGGCIKRLPEQFLRPDADVHYWDTQKKAILYPSNDQEPLIYFAQDYVTPLIIVEDILSAIRIKGCALLGTSLCDAKVKEIRKVTDRVILALDRDTWEGREKSLALTYKEKYGLFFKEFKILKIEKDIKDMSENELNVCLKHA